MTDNGRTYNEITALDTNIQARVPIEMISPKGKTVKVQRLNVPERLKAGYKFK